VGIVSSGGFGDFNVRNSTKCHLDGQVFARRVDAALYMSQKLGFKLADAAQYVRELPERDLPPNDSYQPTPGNGAAKQGEHPK
jgi:hypothetical protein